MFSRNIMWIINYILFKSIYILIREHIYYFCLRITFVSLNENKADYITPRFFILESADILALLGYSIYLQLILLKFCKLDKDLDKNIIQRGKKELITIPMDLIPGNVSDNNNNDMNEDNEDKSLTNNTNEEDGLYWSIDFL